MIQPLTFLPQRIHGGKDRYERAIAKEAVMVGARRLAVICHPNAGDAEIARLYRQNLRLCAGCWQLHVELASMWPGKYMRTLWDETYDEAHLQIMGGRSVADTLREANHA